jgi:hypothetical protein
MDGSDGGRDANNSSDHYYSRERKLPFTLLCLELVFFFVVVNLQLFFIFVKLCAYIYLFF